jgi:Protein of unknown function (DUF3108).
MLRTVLCLGLALAFSGYSGPAAWAQDVQSRTEYNVSLAGIPIAKALFVTRMANRNYSISGHFRSAGIVNLITEISADTDVSGVRIGERLEARKYTLVYRKGKKVETYDVRLRSGNVTSSEITSAPKARPRSWIPVTEADLRSVFDPLSGLIVPEGDDLCPRTLPIFDGESRMDLVLTPKGTQSYRSGDVETEATVCSIRYIPRSGYRKGRKDIDYLAKVRGMEIWFAKAGALPLYAPVRARIPTRYGTVDISAVRFGG